MPVVRDMDPCLMEEESAEPGFSVGLLSVKVLIL